VGLKYKFDTAANYFLVLTGFFVPLSITATDFSMALAAIFGVISGRFLQNFPQMKKSPFFWCTLWFILLVMLSFTWSIAPWGDRLSALHKYSKLLYIPLLLAICTDPRWRERTVIAFLAGTFITVILSYFKAWFGLHLGPSDNPAYVFYTHIETSFLVAFATYLLALYAWKNSSWRLLCCILIAIFSYQEFFINDGRTGWIAYLSLLLLFAVQLTGWKGLLLGIASIGVLTLSFYEFSPKFKGILDQSVYEVKQFQTGQVQTSLGYRLGFDYLGWQLVKQKPVAGYGAGSFATASKDVGGLPGWRVIKTPHNEYLMVMVELGVIGLFSLLLLFGIQWGMTFYMGETKYFAQGLLLVFMISSIYNAFLYLSVSGHFYVLFTALFFSKPFSQRKWFTADSKITSQYLQLKNY